MIKLDEAKKLKPGERVIVTTTKEDWVVEKVEIKGVLPFVSLARARDGFKYVLPPERMHLFTAVPMTPPVPPAPIKKLPETMQESLKEALQTTVDNATTELTGADAEHITNRIEEQFMEEPKLTKPARKPRTKKAK